jgi:hypothetical protein
MTKSKIPLKAGKLFILLILLLVSVPAFAQVDTAWVRRYKGQANDWDDASAIGVDSSGNVYVTGASDGGGTGFDYATIKYYPNGDTAWVRRYNGAGDNWDFPFAIAVDGFGNVYVTGESWSDSTNYDCTTIKYYPDGNTAWVGRFNGLANSSDRGRDIAVDGSGNVYVTGWSWGGTDEDYVTIKYYFDGDTAWVRKYNGLGNKDDEACAIAIDNSSNVYVTGGSWGTGTYMAWDYATIKYYPNGDTAWVRRYNGPGNSGDWASAIALDPSGNVYVTGGSTGTGSRVDYATIKYFPDGDTDWVRRYNGPANSDDYSRAIAAYDSNNVYVTGSSAGMGTNNDYATIKYYHNGDSAWTRRYQPGSSLQDDAYAIAVDGSGIVYVTGRSGGSGTYFDYAIIKYYPDGDTAWVRRYNGPGNGDDDASAVVVDGSGNVYVTGESYGSGTGYDYATIKYYPNGDTAWVRRYNGPSNSNIAGIVKDASTQQNLEDVLVEALQESLIVGSDYSGIDGNYMIPILSPGLYNVRARKPGYETKTFNSVQVVAGQTTTQDFNLNPSPADTDFYDNFADGNADGWDTLSRACDWSVSAGQYILTVPGEHRIWCFSSKGDINLTDYIYEADVYGIHGVDKVICFRFIDKNNFYAVNLRSDWGGNDEVTLNKMQGGTFTADIVSAPYPSQNQTLYHLKVEVSGTDQTNIKVWVEDNQLINWTDPGTPITHGKIAVAAYSGDYGGSTGLPTEVGFTNVLVACPSFDLTVDIPENFIEISNNVTDLFVAYFSLKNNGLTTIHNIETIFDIGGNTFPHTFSSLDPGKQVNENSSIQIPPIWENKNVTISVTSIGGCPVDFHDSKQVSVYYCTGGSDSHPFTIERDSYNFRNPKMDWKKWRQFFTEFSPTPGLILSVLPEFILGWRGHCFGMSASAAAYFRDPSVKPLEEETHAMDLWQEGVFHNIIRYHVAQFLFGQFYSSFVPMEATEAESKAKELITENKPPLVALPPIEIAPPSEQRSSKGAEGHTVTGYKLLRDLSLGTSLLYLYDNEDENTVQQAKFDLNDNTFTYGIWHSTRLSQPFVLYSDEEWLKELWNWLKHEISDLWGRGLSRFGLACPAKMLLIDEYGRRIGFVDGVTFVNEIPGAEVTFIDGGNGDTLSFYDVPAHLNYTVKYFGSDSGYMDAEVLKPTSEETAITLSYVGVEVNADMIATLQVDSTYDYTLKIDRDGNGTIDTVVNPTVDNLAPTPFDLLSPPDQQTVSVYPFHFDWVSSFDFNGDSVFYRVYIDMDSSFSSADSSIFITDTSWTCTIPLKDSTIYYWRVKAFDKKGGVTLSNQTWSFHLVLPFMQGDANGDRVIDISDVVYLLNYLFIHGPAPVPMAAGDATCDGVVDVSDVVYLLNYLFVSGPAPGC